MQFILWMLLVLCALMGSCTDDVKSVKTGLTAPYERVFIVNSEQLVQAAFEIDVCGEHAWTKLVSDLPWNRQHLPSLQRLHVNEFETIAELSEAMHAMHAEISDLDLVFRVSLMWPCWVQSEEWREQMTNAIHDLSLLGAVELVLTHNDGYPSSLFGEGVPGYAGWAHDDSVDAFVAYTESVVAVFKEILPPDTRVYVAFEPMRVLIDGYIGSGYYPPGNSDARMSFVRGMIHQRDAFRAAGDIIVEAGWRPVIAQNIRNFQGILGDKPVETPEERLGYLYNRWLPDGLIYECVDDDFDGLDDNQDVLCGALPPSSVGWELGITYYGNLYSAGIVLEMPLIDGGVVLVAAPYVDVTPQPKLFGHILEIMQTAYPLTVLHVAEVGFSSASLEKMVDWLTAYLFEIADREIPIASFALYSPFEEAQFSSGEWFFHMFSRCAESASCIALTSWGKEALTIFREQG